ncbi:hypothetical protein WR25_08019 [Diploscapter pachys]|uniref:RCK N-terminal domain-containing protein n=1 Tax=Diploscapter pachys TaxID=2018661 RepID=A0A2A2KD86_9BILA|nr:hypothetical protein WR25_08019 [Diploscapter pachys]
MTRMFEQVPVFYGDPLRPEVLHAAKVGEAEYFIITIDDPEVAIHTAERAKRLYPHLKVIARARNRQHVHKLIDVGSNASLRRVSSTNPAAPAAISNGNACPLIHWLPAPASNGPSRQPIPHSCATTSDNVNKPPALAPNRTHSGQIAGLCSSTGITRLETSKVSAQPLNSVRRDMRSAKAPIGNCSTASPTTTVLTMNNATSVAITGRRRQKPNRSAKVTLHASVVGAPPRPSRISGATSNKPLAAQKPKSSSEPRKPRTNGPANWLSA